MAGGAQWGSGPGSARAKVAWPLVPGEPVACLAARMLWSVILLQDVGCSGVGQEPCSRGALVPPQNRDVYLVVHFCRSAHTFLTLRQTCKPHQFERPPNFLLAVTARAPKERLLYRLQYHKRSLALTRSNLLSSERMSIFPSRRRSSFGVRVRVRRQNGFAAY